MAVDNGRDVDQDGFTGSAAAAAGVQARLDTKRANSALTADEHARWLELKDRLGARLAPSERTRRASARVETRIAACFETPEDFQEAVISNLSLGGVFISTASPSEIGTKLTHSRCV